MMISSALAACMSSLAVGNMGNIPVENISLKNLILEISSEK
tara:strand:+ start:1146 stop:1268 length:123 start_codon:yes stop_codon:yes gene_type:complete